MASSEIESCEYQLDLGLGAARVSALCTPSRSAPNIDAWPAGDTRSLEATFFGTDLRLMLRKLDPGKDLELEFLPEELIL